MKLTLFAGMLMGLAACWWRLSTPTKAGEKDRTFFIFASALAAYANAVEIIKALL
jgi:hypothetical protein